MCGHTNPPLKTRLRLLAYVSRFDHLLLHKVHMQVCITSQGATQTPCVCLSRFDHLLLHKAHMQVCLTSQGATQTPSFGGPPKVLPFLYAQFQDLVAFRRYFSASPVDFECTYVCMYVCTYVLNVMGLNAMGLNAIGLNAMG